MRTDAWTHTRAHTRTHTWMHERVDARMHGRTPGCTDARTDARTDEQAGGRAGDRATGRFGRTDGQTDASAQARKQARTNARMHECTNARVTAKRASSRPRAPAALLVKRHRRCACACVHALPARFCLFARPALRCAVRVRTCAGVRACVHTCPRSVRLPVRSLSPRGLSATNMPPGGRVAHRCVRETS